MAQHFLLSSAARTLSVVELAEMSKEQAHAAFASIRWSATDGKPVCPQCGSFNAYFCPRKNGDPRWRCREKDCASDFSLTSGTLFASHKLPVKLYLIAIAMFTNEVKGKSALAMARELRVSYKTSYVLLHKIREAVAEEAKGRIVGGPGKVVEVDGCYIGGYVKPNNLAERREDRRRKENRTGKRRSLVIVRERGPGGRTIAGVFMSEAAAQGFIIKWVAKGSVIHTDSSPSWNILFAAHRVKQVNHEESFQNAGVDTNLAESFFSRLKRSEIGHHHHISGPYLIRYAQEMCWREDFRRRSNGEQFKEISRLAVSKATSRDFVGYWQRHKVDLERSHRQ